MALRVKKKLLYLKLAKMLNFDLDDFKQKGDMKKIDRREKRTREKPEKKSLGTGSNKHQRGCFQAEEERREEQR